MNSVARSKLLCAVSFCLVPCMQPLLEGMIIVLNCTIYSSLPEFNTLLASIPRADNHFTSRTFVSITFSICMQENPATVANIDTAAGIHCYNVTMATSFPSGTQQDRRGFDQSPPPTIEGHMLVGNELVKAERC